MSNSRKDTMHRHRSQYHAVNTGSHHSRFFSQLADIETYMGSGIAYVVLNILRLIAVVSLILVFVASIMIIEIEAKHFAHNFFPIISQLSRMVTSLTLVSSELPTAWTTRYFQRRIPILSHGFSIAWTGWPMIVLAAAVLSDLNSELLSVANLGGPVHTVILVGGVSTGVVGLLYGLMPIIMWRFKKDCRTIRKEGASRDGSESSSLVQPYGPAMQISRPIIGTETGGGFVMSAGGDPEKVGLPRYIGDVKPKLRTDRR